MLIRSEGVGLGLQNRRERGKNKKTKNKHAFCFRYVVLNCMFGRGAGRSINLGTSAFPMCAHDQTCITS